MREETGMAVLLIEHDVSLVAGVADRFVCLHLGEVIAEGSPADVLVSADVVSSFLGDAEPVLPESSVTAGRGAMRDV
jgi:branched-chain amino acid transport system ATP-binding protein